jgi:hypothetical protein
MAIPIISSGADFNAREYFDLSASYILTPQNLIEMKHSLVVEKLNYIHDINTVIELKEVGTSAEGRAINMLSFGVGKTKLLLWSQMHGDEPTATAGLLALFYYMAKNFDTPLVQEIHRYLSIHAIVMLNPDGAERFQRRNAQGIDVNRDAQRLITPEGKTLKKMNDQLEPDFGFNLHDMRGRETVGDSGKLLTIALMAPPFNKDNEDSPTRIRAKKLALVIEKTLNVFINGHIARYKADYMPRAFGDAFQNWAVSTVLVESGLTDNTEAHYLVRLNFVALLAAFHAIASDAIAEYDPSDYDNIPIEGIEMFDLLLKDVLIFNGRSIAPYRADIGINCDFFWQDNTTASEGIIDDIGDLSLTGGRKTINGKNLIVTPGFIARKAESVPPAVLLEQGITTRICGSEEKDEYCQKVSAEILDKAPILDPDIDLTPSAIINLTSAAANQLKLKKLGILDKDFTADCLIFESDNPEMFSVKDLRYVIKNGQIVYQK